MKDPLDQGTRELQLHASALIGYARVSTSDQEVGLQLAALKKAGCHRIFEDVASGAKSDRPGLGKLLDYLREGDTLVVWKLDRLGRSLPHLVQTVEALREKHIGFRSLTENIDTTTPSGELVFHLFAVLAQFERNLIRERTKAGLEIAAARGRKGGRKVVVTPEKFVKACELIKEKGFSVRETAIKMKIGKSALYSALKQRDA